MKNKFIIPALSVFLICVIIVYLYYLILGAKACDGWMIGDWLINFQGGFVRRGLGGYMINIVSDFLNLKLNYTVSYIQIICYLTYISILFFSFYRKKIDVWFIILLLSPVTLLFRILDPYAVGRKEIILYFLFAIYLLFLNKKMLKSNYMILLFSIALTVSTLFHELMFFYLPYFILAPYLKSKIDNEPFRFSKILFVILGSVLAMVPLFFYGKNINGSIICTGLIEKGLSNNICKGILSQRNFSLINIISNRENWYGDLWSYSIALILGLFPFVLFVKYAKHQIVTVKKFLILFLILFLFSSPLFILAADWGRWLNIHFILLLFTSTLLLKDNTSKLEENYLEAYLALPQLWKSNKVLSKILSNIFFLAIGFSYLTLWGMKHFDLHTTLFQNGIISRLIKHLPFI
jgi:hypothetical protein